MTYNLLGFLIFAFVTCITPGPNNILLFSTGSRKGLRKSLPLMAGIYTGFMILLLLSGYGIGSAVSANKTVALVLKIVSTGWLLYLAWVVRSVGMADRDRGAAEVGYGGGLLMQFVNPKAWVMAVSGASAFLPQTGNIHLNVLYYALVYNAVGIPSMIAWVAGGQFLSKMLKSEKSRRITGWVLAGLMVVSIVTVWM